MGFQGVPLGSVLGPILVDVLYDGVLILELPKEEQTIAYALIEKIPPNIKGPSGYKRMMLNAVLQSILL